jgi:hypothetical protein
MQVTDRGLAVLVKHLKNLVHLDLTCCMSLTELGFLQLLNASKLEHLGLRGTHVTDYAVGNLILALEGLSHLDVSHCPHITNQSLVNLAQLLRCRMRPHPGPHAETNPLVFKLMASCVSTTTAALVAPVEVEGSLDDDYLSRDKDRSTASLFGDALTEAEKLDTKLPASAASLLSPLVAASTASMIAAQSVDHDALPDVRFRLRTLLMRSVNVNYITLSYAARFFPDLRVLDLSGSRHLNTLPFRELALACTNLESLNLRDCTRVDDESLIHIFSSASRNSLRTVNLHGCTRITDKSMGFLLNNCTQLRSLNIVDCSFVSNASVTRLTNLLLLTRLEIGSTNPMPTVVNPDITPLSVNRYLNARACGYHLVVLRLYCTAGDDLVLSVVSQRCHKLRELYVQDMPSVTQQRQTKDVIWDTEPEDRVGVTSRGLYHIAYGVCTSLTRLQLVSCDSIDYEGVNFIVQHPPPRLHELQFKNCKGIGVRSHQLLGSGADFGRTQLKRLSVCDDACSTVLEGMRAVMNGCEALEALEVRNCKTLPPLEAPETQAMLRGVRRIPPQLEWFPQALSVTNLTDLQ